jgi:flagellar biogenesis protein FliO
VGRQAEGPAPLRKKTKRIRLQKSMQGMQQLLAVLLVVALAAGTAAWLRHRGLARPAAHGVQRRMRQLELAERLALGPQHSLHLVRLGKREILIGRSPSGLTLLASRAVSDQGEEALR